MKTGTKDMAMYAAKVKDMVSCRQLLEANGIRINRSGFAVCPLHGDTDASLKVYGKDRGWVCYGCHKGGDVINLARGLYDVGFNEAIRRLNDDFQLGLDMDGKASQKDRFMWAVRKTRAEAERKEAERQKALAEKEYFDAMEMWLYLDGMVAENEPARDGPWTPRFTGYLKLRADALERVKDAEVRRMAYG